MFLLCFAPSSTKIRFVESNMWFKMFFILYCPKLDEYTFIWIISMVQNVFYSVLREARWRYVSLNQMCGSTCFVLCFDQRSMKIHLSEWNIWFQIFCITFCPELDESTYFLIKCVVQDVIFIFFAQSSAKIHFL